MRPLLPWLLGLGCVLGLVVACFGDALLRGGQFTYRDAGHFYYPLYQRVQQEWAAGRLPLWEAEENAGMPLLGNPTAAVLYPGKLIYAVLPYAWGARIYILAHQLLAVAGMYALMRRWGTGRAGSGIASLGYAFGAPVLFQYCNVVFLVGAAWVPWAFWAVDRWLRGGYRWALAELALILAMQTLGGDPQASYVVGVCALLYAMLLRGWLQIGWRRTGVLLASWVILTLAAGVFLPPHRPSPPNPTDPPLAFPWTKLVPPAVVLGWGAIGLAFWRWGRRGPGRWPMVVALGGLLGAGGIGLALTGAQLVPVLEFSSLSLRAADDGPHDFYPFSLEPYRVLELAWPGFFGSSFSGNRSWLGMLPPAGSHKLWVPSLYMGGLTLLLAGAALLSRDAKPWRGWLAAMAIGGMLASYGEFASPLWWARWMPSATKYLGPHDGPDIASIRPDRMLRDGDGSPYWLMATALPGFQQFRYPSKLLTFSTLGIAALAGLGWDSAVSRRGRGASILAMGLLAASLVAQASLWVGGPSFLRWTTNEANRGPSQMGPYDAAGALAETRWALAQGAIVGGVSLGLLLLARRRPKLAGGLALAFLAADLAAANAKLVRTSPQADFEVTPKVKQIIDAAERKDPSPGPYRVHRMPSWSPIAQYKNASKDRVDDFHRWESDTLQPKYGVPLGVEYTLTIGTAELYDYHWFFGGFHRRVEGPAARSLGLADRSEIIYYPRRGFDLWNTRYFVIPAFPSGYDLEERANAAFLLDTDLVYPPPDAFLGEDGKRRQLEYIEKEDFQVRKNRNAWPRAWVVHGYRYVKPIRGFGKPERKSLMEEMVYPRDLYWTDDTRTLFDPHEIAWAEPKDRSVLDRALAGGPSDPSEKVAVKAVSPTRVELTVSLNRPGLVVLADVYYPGWRLAIDGRPGEIQRVNRLMRGALVTSGKHLLVYTYDPNSLRWGIGLSVAGLVGLAVSGWMAGRWGRALRGEAGPARIGLP